MKIRIRGPSGQSTVNFDESATIETLRKTIVTETSLPSFDVKYGYPPKSLALEQYLPTKLLLDLDVRLNGEQLIVSKSESSTSQTPQKPQQTAQTVTKREQAPIADPSKISTSQSSKQNPSLSKPASKPALAAGPLSLSRKKALDMSDSPEVRIPDMGGSVVLRVMADDNSCLFRAFAAATMPDLDMMTELRSVVAQAIQRDPITYSKAVLDNQEPDDYCRWIQTEDAWGGQIELDILSRHFDIEICSIDVQSLRVDRYNESASNRCILVYSGIHYDTIAFSFDGAGLDEDVKNFEPFFKDQILPYAVELCSKLKDKHYYTDTAGFKVMCNDCGVVCVGEAGAQGHAKQTGHFNFGEAS